MSRTQLTWMTYASGSELKIPVDWLNENGVWLEAEVVIALQRQDKPKQLEVRVNGVVVAVVPGAEAKNQRKYEG